MCKQFPTISPDGKWRCGRGCLPGKYQFILSLKWPKDIVYAFSGKIFLSGYLIPREAFLILLQNVKYRMAQTGKD